jgi:hypothetical protein
MNEGTWGTTYVVPENLNHDSKTGVSDCHSAKSRDKFQL